MTDLSTLNLLRARGVRLLVVVAWLCLPLLYVWGRVLDSTNTALAIAVGVVAVVAVLAVGIYQAALSGIYSAALYRYAVGAGESEGFDARLLGQAFRTK